MFPEHNEVQSAYVLKEKERLTDYRVGDLQLVFVELPKFNKALDELVGVKDKWLYFLREAPDLDVAPPTMTDVPEIEEAFDIANEANMSREEVEMHDRRLQFIIDQRAAITLAEKNAEMKGRKEGRKEGHKKGHKDGRKEGLMEGEEKMAFAIVKRMLSKADDQTIAQFTGIPLKTIASLRAKS